MSTHPLEPSQLSADAAASPLAWPDIAASGDELEPRGPDRGGRVRVAAGIGVIAGLFFAAFNLLTPGQTLLGQIELAAVLLLAIPSWILSRNPARWALAGNLLIACAFVIFSVLVVLGGVAGTGLYWAFTVPFVAFFLKGQRSGWMLSATFVLLVGAYAWLLAPERLMQPGFSLVYPHGRIELVQFVLALVFYSVMAAMFMRVIERQAHLLHQAQATSQKANEALQRTSQDLMRYNQNISRILSTASHDLRQPAHALGLLTTGLHKLARAPQDQALVNDIESSVKALQDMLQAYFELSALDAKARTVDIRAIPLEPLFNQLARWFREKSRQSHLRLVIKPCPLWVYSDALLLQRVLLNLLSNALRYTDRGSVMLCCRGSADGHFVRIQVRDSGVGIAREEQEKIFDEFYQVGNAARSAQLGLGLGLSVVRRACERLGHRLSLVSAPGRGSTFTLHLPLAPAPAQAEPTEDRTQETGRGQGELVLMVQDTYNSRDECSLLLREWGYSVHHAASAHEALSHVNPLHPPAFIICDEQLPYGISGMDAIKRLREQANKSIPACLLSAETGSVQAQQAQTAQVPILTKPVAPAKLRKLVRQAIAPTL